MKRLYLGRRNDGCYELGTIKKYWDKTTGFGEGFLFAFDKPFFNIPQNHKLALGEINKIKSVKIELEIA